MTAEQTEPSGVGSKELDASSAPAEPRAHPAPGDGDPGSSEPRTSTAVPRTEAVTTVEKQVVVHKEQPRRLKPGETALITVWLIALTGATILALLCLWPLTQQVQLAAQKAGSAVPSSGPALNLIVAHPLLTPDLSILTLGLLSGILGSLVHTFTWLNQANKGSAPTPTQRRKAHRPHDVVWFITAPIQGGLLALVVICALAAGLLSSGQSQATTTLSLFTVAAIGGLTGLFSRRMTAKLAQLVNQVGPKSSTTTVTTAPGHPATTTTTATANTAQNNT